MKMTKLANIAWQTLLFVSESLATDKKITPYLRQKKTVFGKQCWPDSPGLNRTEYLVH